MTARGMLPRRRWVAAGVAPGGGEPGSQGGVQAELGGVGRRSEVVQERSGGVEAPIAASCNRCWRSLPEKKKKTVRVEIGQEDVTCTKKG